MRRLLLAAGAAGLAGCETAQFEAPLDAAPMKPAREIAFGADLIAGFPTETDAMFENSVSLIEACDLAFVHVFPFSPRIGTPAALMPQLPRDVVKARAARLRERSEAALNHHLSERVGRRGTVLIEEIKNGVPRGRLADFTDVHFQTNPAIAPGQRIDATMIAQSGRHLVAAPADAA